VPDDRRRRLMAGKRDRHAPAPRDKAVGSPPNAAMWRGYDLA
jgi:hypothetical protein